MFQTSESDPHTLFHQPIGGVSMQQALNLVLLNARAVVEAYLRRLFVFSPVSFDGPIFQFP